MLFLLTGEVQIGKTRWLSALVEALAESGVRAWGVLSPGEWCLRPEGKVGGEAERGRSGAGRYEKLGIDCVLLPEGERIPFARRDDLARAEGGADADSQSARAGLCWAIDDAAIDQVNAHFEKIAARAAAAGEHGAADAGAGLAVVDELGRLELLRDGGFSSALRLLEAGPTRLYGTAVAIVRASLADAARARLERAWGSVSAIGPDDAGRAAVLRALGL